MSVDPVAGQPVAGQLRRHLRQATRRGFLATCVAAGTLRARRGVAATGAADDAAPSALGDTDPAILRHLPFGTHSHYLQPWRGSLDTVPAGDFLGGLGIVLNDGTATSAASIRAAARYGIGHARIEISWSELDFHDETRLRDPPPWRRLLAACGAAGVRPLIVLNANHGLPVPTLRFDATVLADAPAGARSLRLAAGQQPIVAGRTGLSDISEFWAAEILITQVDADRCGLSKPLPKPLRAGTVLKLATLRYAPFGAAGTAATLAGWERYVGTIATFASQPLGTAAAADKGFDLEIWNELSFGSNFLAIANYYAPGEAPPGEIPPGDATWAAIVERTARAVAAAPARFAGVRLTNGFASTVPWPAAAEQPAAVTAISKHPYPPRKAFPADEQRNTTALDAQGRPTSWVPDYTAFFPEYAATAIQTETIVRDMGPEPNDIYGHRHGRLARPGAPVPVWLTEFGVNPAEAGVGDPAAAMAVKAQAAARAALFYLNKGAERVYLYALSGSDAEYGLVTDATRRNAAAPLAVLARIAAVMREGLDASPSRRRSLGFRVHSSPDSAIQFAGNGSAANPALRNIDMLAILPYQGSDHRFVVAVYFITRDLRHAAAEETVVLDVSGLHGQRVTAALYDPRTDAWRDSHVAALADGRHRIGLPVSDWPRLLVIEDAANAAARQPRDRRDDLATLSSRPGVRTP